MLFFSKLLIKSQCQSKLLGGNNGFGKNKVADLTSKTTSPKVRKELGDLVQLSKMSDKAKQWAGVNDRSRLYYMFGESGVGKTYAVKQYAQEMGVDLYGSSQHPMIWDQACQNHPHVPWEYR